MVYLIGGPPRSGKTSLAKTMSKKYSIPWVSTDMLEVVSGQYMTKKQWFQTHPYSLLRRKLQSNDAFYGVLSSKKIVMVLRKQAVATFPAIDMATISEINDGNDYIVEGYHIEPSLVRELIQKYGAKNIRAIFLTKFDAKKFATDVHKSTTPNDWLLSGTKNLNTFVKVGEMVAYYSRFFEAEAKKHNFKVFNMDVNFKKQLGAAVIFLRR